MLCAPAFQVEEFKPKQAHRQCCGLRVSSTAESRSTAHKAPQISKATAIVAARVQREPRTCTEGYAAVVVTCHKVQSSSWGAETTPVDSRDFDPHRDPEAGRFSPGLWLQGLSGASPWGWGRQWPRWWELWLRCRAPGEGAAGGGEQEEGGTGD